MDWFRNISFKMRLTAFFALIGLLPLVVNGWLTANRAEKVLVEAAIGQLEAGVRFRKTHVEQYIGMIGDQLREFVARPSILTAVRDLRQAFHDVPPDGPSTEQLRRQVTQGFQERFLSEYQRRNPDRAATWKGESPLAALDEKGLFWQSRFIWRHGAEAAADKPLSGPRSGESGYDLIHARHHQEFQNFLERFDFYDLLVIDEQSGHVVYSVQKEIDFASSLREGPFADSGLGKAYRLALEDKTEIQAQRISDYSLYLPSYDEPSAFILTPIMVQEKRIGFLAAQFDSHTLDGVMQNRQGLGQSGETFLIGRLGGAIAYRSNRPDQRGRIGGAIDDPFFQVAMTHGEGASPGYSPDHALAQVYTPLKLPGLDWGIAGVMSLDEIRAPARMLTQFLGMILLLTLGIMSGAATFFGGRLLAPIRHLSEAAGRIADGEWSARIAVTGQDEPGRMGMAFNRMAEQVEQQYWVKENVARVSAQLPSVRTLEELGRLIVQELIALLNAAQGEFYLLDQSAGRYRIVPGYRIENGVGDLSSHAPGEGIVGRCALEQQRLHFDAAACAGMRIATGLGEASPAALLAIPLIYRELTLGVAVIASFTPFSPIHGQLVEELSLLGGIFLDNLDRIRHIEELLEETRTQAQELETGQQELEQMNQELESHVHALRLSDDELRAQQVELERANQELEEQSQLLETRNEQLEQLRLNLERASRHKSEFLSSMSHELRTPLNSILILSREFMKNEDGRLAPDQVDAARVIHQSGSELLTMIDEILDLSRIEAGRVTLHPEMVDPLTLAGELSRQFAPLAKEKNLDWRVETGGLAATSLWIDVAKVRRIVKNLIVNAFKFTSKGGVAVEIVTREDEGRDGHALTIRVQDTGRGIAQENLEAIFDPFWQIKQNAEGQQDGVGLGLAIARKLTGLLGGTLQVTSTPGEGSLFTLSLACVPPPVSAPAEPTAPAVTLAVSPVAPPEREEPLPESRPLLIIDDDPIFAGEVAQLAKKRGFRCDVAATGAEGLALAIRHRPFGVILDLGLPDLPGEEVLKRLQEDPRTRNLPVHIISARDDRGGDAPHGTVGYLTKPADESAILQALRRVTAAMSGKPYRLLLVEDREEERRAVIDLFADQEVEVVEAASGDAALDRIGESSFDCLILDLGLPDMDGFQLLEQMDARLSGNLPPVIVHSARELTREEHGRLQRYTDSFVIKSAHAEERLRDEVILFLHRIVRENPGTRRHSPPPGRHREDFLTGKTVLLADDDVRNIFAMTRALEQKGMTVLMAGNGLETIAILDKTPGVDIVLMDIMMPKMDGYAALREIRGRHSLRGLPILALTAKAMPEDQKKCLEAGANEYLSKPVNMERLFEVMRIWLANTWNRPHLDRE